MGLHEKIEQYYPQYHDIQQYPADQCACIRKTDEEWGILGNFYHAPIVVEGVTFDCTERLFHLMASTTNSYQSSRNHSGCCL